MSKHSENNTEDWSHLGKPDTGAVFVTGVNAVARCVRGVAHILRLGEAAIWTGFRTVGLPKSFVNLLKWAVRFGLGVAILYAFYPMILLGGFYAVRFVFAAVGTVLAILAISYVLRNLNHSTSHENNDDDGDDSSGGLRNGNDGYGYYDSAGLKVHD